MNIIGIIFLISVFLIINVIYKNVINIVVFLVSYVIIEQFIKNKYTAVLGAYVIGIGTGIVRNFHLLENFEIKNTNEKIQPLNNDPVFQKMNSDPIIKINPDIKNIVSDKLLKKYIEHIKDEDDTIVYTRKVFIYDLKPTINELRQGKIKKMKEKNVQTPIVISSDNFIIDGHHRWYSQKMNNMAQNNTSKDNDENYINATIINMKIDSIIKKLKDFKEDYNDNSLNNFKLDEQKIKQAEQNINNIKSSINNLDVYMKDLKNINLV